MVNQRPAASSLQQDLNEGLQPCEDEGSCISSSRTLRRLAAMVRQKYSILPPSSSLHQEHCEGVQPWKYRSIASFLLRLFIKNIAKVVAMVIQKYSILPPSSSLQQELCEGLQPGEDKGVNPACCLISSARTQ